MKNQYEVTMDVEPLQGEPFSINKGGSEDDQKITFNVQKDVRLDPNKADIYIYNLNQAHEQAFAFKYIIPGKEQAGKVNSSYGGKVTLYAGYRGAAKQIFSGNIVRSFTTPTGGDRVTYIQAMHSIEHMSRGIVNKSFPKGTGQEKILSYIFEQISDVGLSQSQKAVLKKSLKGLELDNSETLQGSATKALMTFSNRFAKSVKIYFDENGPQILGPGESNGDTPIQLSAETGLMGSPSLNDIGAVVRMRLNPGLRNGSPIDVDSEVNQSLLKAQVGGNQKLQRYIAEKITHLGDNYPGGDWTTEVSGIYEGGVISA